MERFALDGLPILCWPFALSEEQCEELAEMVPWKADYSTQSIVENLSLACRIASIVTPSMHGAPTLRFLESVTMTRAYKVPWHVDQRRGAEWKICIYLDDVIGGGTVFRDRAKKTELRPSSEQGTIVMFDLMLEHRTDDYDVRTRRRVIGLRAVSI